MTTPSPNPPGEIEALARERAAARAAREYARADSLRARIEMAGWRVVDRGTAYHLEPAAPPTIEAAGVIRYGSATAVPSVLDEPATAAFTVLLLAEEWPDDLARTLGGLRAHAPEGTHVAIVANQPSPSQAARLDPAAPDLEQVAGAAPEVVWTSARLGHAAALNVGLRRARGSIIVLVDTSVEPTGDALAPLAEVLADPGVAVAGGFGLASADLRHFVDAGGPGVDAIEAAWLAFRRDDMASLGPLDERFVDDSNLDVWLSLVLRAGVDADQPPRRAVRVALPLARHERREPTGIPAAERVRRARRNAYRVLDRFRDRTDLTSGPSAP